MTIRTVQGLNDNSYRTRMKCAGRLDCLLTCTDFAAGVVGPWLIGAAKVKYGTFTAPVALLASLSVFAVLFFAALMPQLPVKQRQVENDAQTLL
jgi:cyanate permease